MGLTDDRLDRVEIDVGMQAAIDRHRGSERAITETENFVYFDRCACCQLDGFGVQTVGAAGLTGFGATHLHDGTDRRSGAEILVETDDSVHFGDREIEDICEQRNAFAIDVTEVMLDGVKRRHEPAGPLTERSYERVQFALGRNDIHGLRSYGINGTIEPRMVFQIVNNVTSAVL